MKFTRQLIILLLLILQTGNYTLLLTLLFLNQIFIFIFIFKDLVLHSFQIIVLDALQCVYFRQIMIIQENFV